MVFLNKNEQIIANFSNFSIDLRLIIFYTYNIEYVTYLKFQNDIRDKRWTIWNNFTKSYLI